MKNEEMKFEERLKNIADQHAQVPSPEVWLNVRNSVLQKRSRKLSPLWIAGGLFLALLIGALSSEFILKPFGLHSNKPEIKTPATSDVNPSASGENGNKSIQLNSVLSLHDTIHASKNAFSLNRDSAIAQKQKSTSIASSQTTPVTSHFYFQPKNISSSVSMAPDSNDEQLERNSVNESENSLQLNSISSNNLSEGNHSSFDQQAMSNSSASILPEKIMSLNDQTINAAQHRDQKIGMLLPKKSNPLNATIEADFIPLMNYSWNTFPLTKYQEVQVGDSLSFVREPDTSSFRFKGFSSGINFYYHLNSKAFFGAALHFSRLTTAIHYPIYGYSIYYPSSGFTEGASQSGYVTAVAEWFDVSFMYGVRMFPQAKNHLQFIGGAGFSHLLNVNTGNAEGITGSVWWNGSTYEKTFSMSENQFQLFTEADYLRDFGSHIGASIGAQFHLYPLDLQAGKNVTQHQFWLGLKLGIDYTIPAKN